MLEVNYPEPAFRTRSQEGRNYIFDPLRKKWILLTPEEWVRQNFIQFLLKTPRYPAALIALEKEIRLGDLKKRFDILVYNNQHQPWMMIECKGPAIRMDNAVLDQVLRYNISVPVEFIVVTNGPVSYAWQKREGKLEILSALPSLV